MKEEPSIAQLKQVIDKEIEFFRLKRNREGPTHINNIITA
jgi:hypothetical protein